MTGLATVNGSELAIREGQSTFDDKQLAALRQLGVANASNADVAIFFHHCVRTGLDPFAKQLYLIERQGKQTIQTGIDGFRLIARRAADARHESLGYHDTLWCGEDGQWTDVWLKSEHPAAAKVTVLRDGQPFPAVALWSEYVALKRDGSITQMWKTKGALMIAKCAEALALRKAFPQDLSGIYTSDEMQQADNNRQPAARQSRPKDVPVEDAQPVPPAADPEHEALVEMHEAEVMDPDEPDWTAVDAQRFAELIDGASTATELHAIAADIAASMVQGDARDQLRKQFSAKAKAVAS